MFGPLASAKRLRNVGRGNVVTVRGGVKQDMTDESDKSRRNYEGEIAGFRQPMVTSIGILLGFQLAFLANWALTSETSPAVSGTVDTVLALAFLFSIALFTLVLFRILDNRIVELPGERYRVTLRLYLVALISAFSGLAAALFA